MGDVPEPRCKIWVGRDRTFQVKEFQPIKVSCGMQRATEIILTALEISSMMKEMEDIVLESLDRQEIIEKQRLIKTTEETVRAETGVKPSSVPKNPVQKNLNNIKKSDDATTKQIKYIKDIMGRDKEYAGLVSDFLTDNNTPLDSLSFNDASFLIKKMKK